LTDDALNNIMQNDFDLIVLHGGQPGTSNLRKDARVTQLVKKVDGLKKYRAICAAPLVLMDAEILGNLIYHQPSLSPK
jgi:protein deglycase